MLLDVGPRLRRLHLSCVNDVSVHDVTFRCSQLHTLEMTDCQFHASRNAFFHRQLFHFKNLAFLTLKGSGNFVNFNNYLTCCVHLERFTASNIAQLDDAAVYFILKKKGFQELKEFSAHHCGHLTIKSAVFLIENCLKLSQIRGVRTWSGINKGKDMPYLQYIAMRKNVHIFEV
jgi:hypothetical protein